MSWWDQTRVSRNSVHVPSFHSGTLARAVGADWWRERRRGGRGEGRATNGGRRRAGDGGGPFGHYLAPDLCPQFTMDERAEGVRGPERLRATTRQRIWRHRGSHCTRIRQGWEHCRPPEAIRRVDRPEYRRGRRTLQSWPYDLSLPAGPRLRWRVHRRTHTSLSRKPSEMIASSRRSANMISAMLIHSHETRRNHPRLSRPMSPAPCRPPHVARPSSPAPCRPPSVARRPSRDSTGSGLGETPGPRPSHGPLAISRS
jgi:hypothetical protein